ncbi:hypothetical protein M3Y97_00539200 [Aphelenchoides bicaudatus]|nr:hypothetical protein M3Y97_00539200 [Aphelenchoides bicaudatus]
MSSRRLAVVGAGPVGLTSAKHAVLNGFDVEIFDKKNAIGGRLVKRQYSAIGSAFSDFPLESNEPMTKLEAQQYLIGYAKAFNLTEKVCLNTEVVDIRRHADYEQNGKWTLKYKQVDDDEIQERVFDAVLVCTGFKQKPWRPNEFRMESRFKGQISYASDFKSADKYANKVVVLVGFGNSSSEIARHLGPIAKKTYIAARRGEWTWEQFDSDGKPFDLNYNNRLHYTLRSVTPKLVRNFIWERESTKHFVYSQKPGHRFLSTFPVFIDGLEELLSNGRLEFEENLLSFTEDGVEFKSGRVVEHVIFCTGYKFDFDLIEDGFLVGVHDNDFQMYMHMFPVELRKHPTLACIGFVQPQLGCVWPIAELQAQLFFSVLNGKFKLPSIFDMRKDAEIRRCNINLDFLRTRRHTHVEDFVHFSDELSALIEGQAVTCKSVF